MPAGNFAPSYVVGRLSLRALLVLLLLGLPACDDLDYPKDPDGTLERVIAGGRMRVAAVDHDPWVLWNGHSEPGGAEARLVMAFAQELHAAVEWRRASAFDALEALKRGDIDLAVGGFTEAEISAHQGAAPTYAYFTEALVVAARPGAPLPEELDGQKVYSPPDLMADGLIEDAGGAPVSDSRSGLVALPHWELPGSNLVPTGIDLHRNRHVMAVPRGENAWVGRLERFLRRNQHGLEANLRESAR